MPAEEEKKFRYFSSVPGFAVARFGSTVTIGASRSPSGYVWNTEVVVAIPESEFNRYRREYTRVLRNGSLLERTKAEFDAYRKKRSERVAKVVEARERENAKILAEALAKEPSAKTKSANG